MGATTGFQLRPVNVSRRGCPVNTYAVPFFPFLSLPSIFYFPFLYISLIYGRELPSKVRVLEISGVTTMEYLQYLINPLIRNHPSTKTFSCCHGSLMINIPIRLRQLQTQSSRRQLKTAYLSYPIPINCRMPPPVPPTYPMHLSRK